MGAIKKFEDLFVWKLSRELCGDIFRITKYDTFSKDFKFKEQIRNSSGSVMDNIAEGFERNGNREFIQFLSIAKGSCGETRSQLYRALDFQYIVDSEFNVLKQKTEKLSVTIGKLINYLKQSEIKGSKYKKIV